MNVFVGLVIKIKLGIGMNGMWDIYIKEGSLNYMGIGISHEKLVGMDFGIKKKKEKKKRSVNGGSRSFLE